MVGLYNDTEKKVQERPLFSNVFQKFENYKCGSNGGGEKYVNYGNITAV